MKTIRLPCFGIVIHIGDAQSAPRAASIVSELHNDVNHDYDWEDNTRYHAAMDCIESIIMAHAMAGIDVESPAYIEGIETAVESAAI